MALLNFLAQAFINAFGITQPSAGQRRTVSLVLGGALLAVVLLLLVASAFYFYKFHSSGGT